MKPLKKQVTFPIRIKRALTDFKIANKNYTEYDLFAHAFQLGVNKGNVIKGAGITEALRDQARYKTLIKSKKFSPSNFSLWDLNLMGISHSKKDMDKAVDIYVSLQFKKGKSI